jgi:threonyl-tRNA synthetase
MLQRIYGTAYSTQAELTEYLRMVEEAEKRDHRKIGKEQELFMMHEYAPGMPFFLPYGEIIFNELVKFSREISYGEGYSEVKTPQLFNAELWKESGHWDHYQEVMYHFHDEDDNMDIGVKPMNCPGHMLVFKNSLRSYRDLPLRTRVRPCKVPDFSLR